eukprot:gnl/MRDRNA2_/MRDRNA2_108347_c0_seq1.p1 gnl/MRDRNA2_/MRDRNA2_108347_c0~~gnl/MRDRNA2_/MRDRNA2_108347_c0_seq1.p1  ORF type:complete len:493 (-),score=45.93 gnl/MRDRNA2_/MRDRNA2_108347_c0_seq1:31-1356(-)
MSNDSLGRRMPMLISLSGMCLFSGLSAFCYNFWMILLCWIVAGFFFGFGLTSWNAFCTETSPKNSRLCNFAISLCWSMTWSSIVALFIHCYIDGPEALTTQWRTVVLLFRIPNLIWIALSIFPGYVESPHFLVNKGRHEQANAELEKMRKQNNCPEVSIEFEHETSASKVGLLQGFKLLFGPQLLSTTYTFAVLLWLMMFCSDGSMYAASMVLHFRTDFLWEHAGLTPSLALSTVALFGLVGYFVAVLLERWVGRKSLICLFLTGVTGACGFYILGSWVFKILEGTKALSIIIKYSVPHAEKLAMYLVLIALCMIRLCASVGSVALCVSISEAFPTSVRATAGGFCSGIGRTGSLAAPFIFEYLLDLTGRRCWYFMITAVLCTVSLPTVILRLRETKGQPLQESIADFSKAEAFEAESVPLKHRSRASSSHERYHNSYGSA